MHNVFVIVVTYNGEKWINKCFSSLEKSSFPVKIIAVDNASSDKTVSILKNDFPCVEIIEGEKNLGFGRANNIGLEIALKRNADFVFLLNQDAWVAEYTIESLIQVSEANQQFGIISPLHLNKEGTNFEYKFEEYIQSSVCPGFLKDIFLDQKKPVYETTFVNAAAWLIPTSVIKKVGGFDPLFFHYGEDTDYIQRIQFYGYKVGISPSAKIFHDSRIKAWEEIMWEKNRMVTFYLTELKNINNSFRSNFLVFSKNRFDDLTSCLLYRQFRKFFFRSKVLGATLFQVRKIKKARKMSLQERSFLN